MSSKPSEFSLRIAEKDGRVTVNFPTNTMLSEINAEEFARELLALAERQHLHLVVDLSGVAVLTSVILSKLIAINGRLRETGGRLTLVNPTPIIRQVFTVTRLDTILEVHAPADTLPA